VKGKKKVNLSPALHAVDRSLSQLTWRWRHWKSKYEVAEFGLL